MPKKMSIAPLKQCEKYKCLPSLRVELLKLCPALSCWKVYELKTYRNGGMK